MAQKALKQGEIAVKSRKKGKSEESCKKVEKRCVKKLTRGRI